MKILFQSVSLKEMWLFLEVREVYTDAGSTVGIFCQYEHRYTPNVIQAADCEANATSSLILCSSPGLRAQQRERHDQSWELDGAEGGLWEMRGDGGG